MAPPKPVKDKKSNPPHYLPRWIIFVIIFGLLILAFFVHKAHQRRLLNDKLQSYRDAGQPADADDLEKWLPTPPDDQNATLQIINATAYFTSWSNKSLPNDPNLAQMYPLLILPGLERSDNPPPDWNRKNVNLLPIVGNVLSPQPGESLDENTKMLIADFLADNVEGMNRLHQALQLNQFRYPADYSQGIETLMPNLGDFRKAAKRLQLQILLHLENAHPDLAVQSVTDSFRLSRVLCHEPTLVAFLVSAGCTPIAINNLEYTLCRYPLNNDQLNDIAAVLTDLQSTPGLSLALMGERTITSDAIYHDPLHNFLIIHPQVSQSGILLLNTFGLIDMDHLLYLDFMDQYIAVLNLPFDQRLQAAQAIDNQIQNLSGIHILIKMMIPVYTRVFGFDLRNHAQLQAARTALAVERYRFGHNDCLPNDLTDLATEYLDTVPLDPYDGLPIKYQKTDFGYIIYSIGEDLTDDGGIRTDPAGNPFTTGTDITLTIKRK